ncbi:succinate dehydrogenase flavoprotein subunit [Rhodopirellula europaea]|jgi:succinate dehydrogenase / fumarate reductase flavoprotein subunit|uniref:succinate dehydrogenase n=1 Tax=Rhodopirellula europaea SH398 TaxID=1263868 RepID=M5SJA5_9BACT|nr:succinate dehydrogenase flavoprotein subunit [Rhodopirellula europaea]EMI26279.1 succinate dehydrogenase or fumarate reductase, flavoprotein subunit [Rhodopirellula europaea SH398]MCR9207932.1 succinate dehydrogenase flavoprotein subunit [bacterium]
MAQSNSPTRVVVVGGGLAGLASTMKLTELGAQVDLISLTPVKRSHSVCAQGGINSCNDATRQLGDDEWKHLDDTVYGGDFLNHQPPVKEMAYWAPKVIELMDRLGVPFNRTGEGFIDRRRFGGTLYKRTAFAGATTGQQLLYALDEQVRRQETEGNVRKFEFWDFLGPIQDETGRCRGVVAQDMVSMEIKAFPADAVVVATGGCGLIYGRSTMSVFCTGSAASRCFQNGAKYANAEFIQVHPTAIPGADKLRLMSESARGEGGRVWVPRTPQDSRGPRDIPEADRYYFLEERYPEYGNLVPRDIATREIFDICVNEGLSVEDDRMCVYLDLTHIPRHELDRKLGGILEIYEKFQGVDPRDEPMKIFPAVHYSMGGLWADYVKGEDGGLEAGAPRNHMTSIDGLYAIGECDYHYHGANRLGANSLLSCIFTGLFTGSSIMNYSASQKSGADDVPQSLLDSAVKAQQDRHDHLLNGNAGSDENPYLIHQELGDLMTRVATVVRRNDQLEEAIKKVDELHERAMKVSLADTGSWTNQNVIFAKSLQDMFPLAKALLKGALQRDECRGAHFKPDFKKPSLTSEDPVERRRQAEAWCDEFEANNEKYLKTTVASWNATTNQPDLAYEDVDTSLIPPRPRLYGLVGAEAIEEVWNERAAKKLAQSKSGTGLVGAN